MNWLRKFMIGRNGSDQLSFALLITYIIIYMAASLMGSRIIMDAAYLLLILCLFRMFSRNIEKRRQENIVFLQWQDKVTHKLRGNINCIKSIKTHRYYKCPNCKQKLRVPRGVGKIRITCPRCKEEFLKKA